jgi:GntR family transcriptional regulator
MEEKLILPSKVEQAVSAIRCQIEQKLFLDGRLPSEPKLALQLGLSRGTVRQAIEQLAHEGLLVRRHGSGTFINANVLDIPTRLEEVWDFVEMIAESGHVPGIRHHDLHLSCPHPSILNILHLPEGEEALTTANVFLADGVPVIYCIDVIPANLVKHAYRNEELQGPVYTFLEQRCSQSVVYNITEVLPVTADEKVARLLECEVGDPLHLFIETGFNENDIPVIYSEEYYRPEYFSFKVVRKMVSTN